MTPEQVTLARAYQAIDQIVVMDLVVRMQGLSPELKVGACELLAHLLMQRIRIQRDATRGPRTVKKA